MEGTHIYFNIGTRNNLGDLANKTNTKNDIAKDGNLRNYCL